MNRREVNTLGTGLVPVRRMLGAGLGLDLMAGVVIWGALRLAFGVFQWAPLADR